jgi:hypothetical protein
MNYNIYSILFKNNIIAKERLESAIAFFAEEWYRLFKQVYPDFEHRIL